MARRMKKLVALLMALILCAGQLTVVVSATEESSGTTTTTVTPVENGTETKTVEVNTDSGTTTTTVKTETRDPATGSETKKTEVERTDSSGSSFTSEEKETTTVSGGGTQTDVQKDWESTDVKKDYDQEVTPAPEASEDVETGTVTGQTTTTTETKVTTEVEGSENQNQTITHNSKNNTETVEGSMSGSETTTITDETVTTTVQEGVKLGEDTKDEETKTEDLDETNVTEGDTDWVPGDQTDNDWVNGDPIEGNPGKTTTVPGSTTTTDATPENPYNVTLNMTPGGSEVQVKKEITLADVSDGKFTMPTGRESNVTKQADGSFKVTASDGSYYIIAENKDGSKVTGWTITHNPVESKPPVISTDPDEDVGTITSDTGWKETENTTTYIDKKPAAEAGTVTNPDGSETTTTIEKTYHADGSFKGYKVTKVTVGKGTGESTITSARNTTKLPDDVKTDFTLPTNVPAPGTTTNPDGTTTTITVEDLMENGKHVGYTVKTETTSPDGTYQHTEVENLYGTDHEQIIEVTKDPTTEEYFTTTTTTTTEVSEIIVTESHKTEERIQEREVTYNTTILTDQDVYQLVDTDDGMFFLYKGKMYDVKAITGNMEYSHGDTTLDPIKPSVDLITAAEGEDLRNKNNTSDGLFGSLSNDTGNPNGFDFRYVGNGVASALQINRWKPKLDGNGNLQYDKNGNVILENGNLTNHQFALQDASGNIHYVYCCDIATDARSGYYYDIQNLKDASYYQGGDDAVDHIRAVAMNGYWGTEATTSDPYAFGSLEAVQKMMKSNVNQLITIMKDTYGETYTKAEMEDLIDSLTEGQALSATQAAIWEFGNKDGNRRLGDTIVQARSSGAAIDEDHEDSVNVQLLYELLISDAMKNSVSDKETDILDEKDITGASLKIKGEATEKGKTKTDADGNKLYNTDLTFSLAVEKSSLTGNLKVVVKDQNGKVLREEQLVTDDSNFVGKLLAENTGDDSGSYTITDLELAEGVKINLNLVGYQNLDQGVYLYTSESVGETTSQTFVGVSQGKRDVNLSVDLKFDVEDPKVQHVSKQLKQTRKDTVKGTKTDTREFNKDTTQTKTGGTVATDVHHDIEIYGTVTTKSTKTEITKKDRNWESFYRYVLKLVNDEDGDEEEEGGGNFTTILDEEVPLADAPQTGDISGLWAAMSLISLGGMLMLARKKED